MLWNLIQRWIALCFLLFFLPLGVGVALMLLCHRVPVFYLAKRVGHRQKMFDMWKFTSMRAWKEQEFSGYLSFHPEAEESWRTKGKLLKDPRIFALGKLLRRYSIDELPQLWNVLKGNMALVGPRPISVSEQETYGLHCGEVFSVLPGLTGLWQVSGRNGLSYSRRIALDVWYVRHRTWKLDCWILGKTLGVVCSGTGAY